MPLRIVFFGTPAFAGPSLDALVQSPHAVVGVVTQPDRPRGRGQRVSPSPVKVRAGDEGIGVFQPERLGEEPFLDEVRRLRPDLGVVAAYGRILPQRLLDVPGLGMVNVHASLLPRWRGAAPVHRAVIAGDAETGVTIMRVVRQLDAGPMLARRTTAIGPADTSVEIEDRLARMGAALLIDVIDRLEHGGVTETPQDERLVTYAPRLERHEGAVDWAQPAARIHNLVRGLQPWPLAATAFRRERVLLLAAEPAAGRDDAPGTILAVNAGGLDVATGRGAIRLLRVQPEGRGAMSARDFANGRQVRPGERFEALEPR
jgi:methionyl-tRNA formyltransferase